MEMGEHLTRNVWLDNEQHSRIVERWNAVYPALRATLTEVIRAQCATDQPTWDVSHLERVRLDLGQLDRGVYRGGCPGRPVFSPDAALRLVKETIRVTPAEAPHLGDVFRLAAELADCVLETRRRVRATGF